MTSARLAGLFEHGVLVTEPFTVASYLALGETEQRTELVEGRLVLVPSPGAWHQFARSQLAVAVDAELPDHLAAIPGVDVDLRLAAPDEPGWARCPDLVVAPRTACDAVREGECLAATDVVLVVEILSRSTRRTDRVTKRGEYADAGIPHYWIVDLEDPVSMTVLHLAGEFGYADGGVVTGTYSATEPFPVELDLDALVRA